MPTGSEQMDGGGRMRPNGSRLQRDGRIGLGLFLIVAVALVVASSAPPAAPPSGPAASGGASSPPVAGISPAPDPTQTIPPTAWEPVDMGAEPATGVATLEPTKAGDGGLALDTAFRLTSLDGRSPETLAAALVADPPIEFRVEAIDGATAVVRPAAPLKALTGYRISLARADGTTEATWAALAAGPLRVVTTVPEDESTGVPRDTGIEFTFDQYGVNASDVSRFLRINPAVTGTFHVAGRKVAFARERPLAKGRLYTVTLRQGLPLAGTGQVLAEDVVVRFETRSTRPALAVSFRHPLADGNPREATAVAMDVESRREGVKRPSTIPITIHRLAGLAGAMEAYEAIRDFPSWTVVSTTPAVSAKGLPRVFRGDVQVRAGQEGLRWVKLPRQSAGWYLVTERSGGPPSQLVLQVTDLSAFTLFSVGPSAVWVNDLATGEPVQGAAVSVDGTRIGRTDARGILEATAPTLAHGPFGEGRSIIVARAGGRAVFTPVGEVWCDVDCGNDADDWWHLVTTDRSEYRTTDTINVWGIVHARDDDAVPATVTLTLRPSDEEEWGDEAPTTTPIVTVTARPDANGAFIAAVPIAGLPAGGYAVRTTADGTLLGHHWLDVGALVKPAYRLAVETDRHAIIAGTSFQASVDATFFEGTPVAGTEVQAWTSSDSEDEDTGVVTARTDAMGHASATLRAGSPYGTEQWDAASVSVRPTLPEEGDISGGARLMVFRGSAVVDVDAALRGTRLAITGRVSDVAFDRYDEPAADLWSIDPRGEPRPGASVRLKVVEERATRRQTGTRYDFILKRVVPVYDYGTKRSTILTDTITAGADGRFDLTTTVRDRDRDFVVTVGYTDEAGRKIQAKAWASRSGDRRAGEQGTWIESVATGDTSDEYSIGDTIRVRFQGGGGDVAGSRYLFVVAQRGLRYVTVGNSPTFRRTFDAASVPGVSIVGVRFNGSGYEEVVNGYRASFRAADRSLAVALTPDRARYAPGETATIAVETRNATGRPVPATVVVRAIDEKLFSMDAAAALDTRTMLYHDVGPGLIAWASSHRTPFDDIAWGKGDAGGGDEGRSEFRDWLAAELVHTGADGTATVTLPLSDDLTSWRVLGSGIDDALEVGDATLRLPVGLPFFVEATIAPEYLVTDRPVIRLRAFGSNLAADETVTFTVRSDTLRMGDTRTTASAFTAAEVALPALSTGEHRIRIEATAAGGGARSDTLTRTFTVVTTRTAQTTTASGLLDGALAVRQGSGMTRLVLTDAGRGRVVPLLESLRWPDSQRADDLIAARIAALTLREEFGLADTPLPDLAWLDPYRRGGLALLPYSSVELEVSALAGMSGDREVASAVEGYLWGVRQDGEERRDRQLLALAGLAGSDRTVLPEVRAAAARDDLAITERISVALAAVTLGDEALARELLTSILEDAGVRYGNLVRVDAGDDADATVQTARLAIVAASLGDPVAADMERWVDQNASPFASTSLERALAAHGWAMRVPGASAVAALTVDGERSELRIESGRLGSVSLTPAQAATAALAPVTGTMLFVQTWETALEPASLVPPAGLTVTRTVSPNGTVATDDVVIVTLTVDVPTTPAGEDWRVVELVPSGLVPVTSVPSCSDDECEEEGWGVGPAGAAVPDRVDGQRIQFTVAREAARATHVLRYAARVVTPGTYTWEPAVVQSTLVPSSGRVLPATSVTITSIAD